MSVTIDRECVEHAQAPRTRFHRAVSLQSRAAMLGAQVGIRSLVAAWMAAPDFPWPTQDRPFGAAALGPNPFRATTWKRDPAEPGVARPGQPACDIVDRPCRSAVRSLTRWTAIDGCTRPATVRATLWWPAIPPVATSHS